jgi:hypothetical protein
VTVRRQSMLLRRTLWLVPAAALAVAAGAARGSAPAAAAGPPALDGAVRAVLDDVDAHGDNPATHGLYINWSADDTRVTNLPDRSPARHDGLTDLRQVLNMTWYEHRHPGDASQAVEMARLGPSTRAEADHYSSATGWVYWQYLHLASLTGDAFWTQRAQTFAAHLAGVVDPLLGVVHGHLNRDGDQPACDDGYRVDHDLESGLALVDAGHRFGDPLWTLTGLREATTVIAQGFDTTHLLFDHTVCDGTAADRIAKTGEESDEILALLDTGAATGVTLFTDVATRMLDGLVANATGLHDTRSGGFFFAYDLGTGTLLSAYKETRQLTLLTALHEADARDGGRYAALEAEMADVALRMLQHGPRSVGYPYRETPTFGFYPGERYVTSEAAGIALEGLQAELDPTLPAAAPPLLPLLPLAAPATAQPEVPGAPAVAASVARPAPAAVPPPPAAAPAAPPAAPAAPAGGSPRLAPPLPAPLPAVQSRLRRAAGCASVPR